MPRGDCGAWLPWVEQIYKSSQLAIWGAYMVISLILVLALTFERRMHTAPVPLTLREKRLSRVCYSLFIGLCGVGHLEGVLSFGLPAYHLFTLWHLATAIVSWWAVFVALRLRSKIITGV